MIEFFKDGLTFFGYIIAAVIIFKLIAFFANLYDESKSGHKKAAAEAERRNKSELENQYGLISVERYYKHVCGLPIPENAECELWECNDCLLIYYGNPFILNYSKILSIELLSNTEVKKQYFDNTSGAIAGSLLLGPLGALVGGGKATATDIQTRYFVTVTYKSNDELNYIFFDVTDYRTQAKKFVYKIKSKILANGNNIVEL